MGVIPEGTTLAPRNPGVPAWDDLTDNQRAFSARLQEAFAAMLEHTDDQIGRLTGFLERRGLLDNTLLVLLSDNGASREGGPFGVMDEFSFFNAAWEDIDEIATTASTTSAGPTPTPTTRGAGPRSVTPRCAGTSRTPTAEASGTP